MSRFLYITIAVLSCVLTSFGQEKQEKPRPKVGLVMSGGGAKGLAHIGVLKVLEQEGVKVDYVVGTSMGAIVGGLYASGYTATELDSIFNSIDASALIKDYIPRISKSFYEKSNDEIYALSLPFDNFKLGLPKALSRGMFNYNLMNKLLAHVRHVRDFKDLNIPFLCISTNVETGEAVILDKGYLPQAILASGAFPSLFAPVNIDGKYLVDGGIVNNYPIEELRKMGADIIIGVDVQDGLKTIDEIQGANDLLLQISNYSTIRQMRDKIPATDIYVKPDIVGYTVVSFDEGKAIIERGATAAASRLEQLKLIGGNKNILKEQYVPKFKDSIFVNDITVSGLTTFTNRYIHGKLGFKPNTKISLDQLSEGINQLNATENFSAISYRFDKDGTRDNFILDLVENPVKRYLKLGLHYDGLMKSAALVNITQRNFLLKSDVASLDIGLGDNLRYNFNYFVDNGFYWSVGISSKYSQFGSSLPFRILEENFRDLLPEFRNAPSKFNVDYSDLINRFQLQTFYKQKYLLGIGMEHRYLNIKSTTISQDGKDVYFEKNNYLGAFANLTIDTYDNKYFPRKGFLFKGEFKNYFYSSDFLGNFTNYSTVLGQIGYAARITNKLSIDLKSQVGSVIGGESAFGMNYFIGGYGFAELENVMPFFGYDFLSLGGDSFITGKIQFDYEIFKRHHINIAANYGNIGKNIFENSDWFGNVKYSGYALGYGMQTMIGPIEVKFTYSPETGERFTWFGVGFWF